MTGHAAARHAPAQPRRRAVLRRLWSGLPAALLLGLATSPAQAQAPSAAEYQVKAAFLVKFGSYVEWPAPVFEGRDSPFVIGVLAAGAVADEVERAAAGAVVDGRPVLVRRLERLERSEPFPGMHLLFIDRSRSGLLADTLGLARGRPLLTVTESEQALALGVMVNFVIVENKVRFDIALAPAEASQLKISARLLAVARRVLKG
ncbi:YfiR family protein [Azohydromonas aeria]|uniref:YfiR family protein n=1 Tax=Azohydromonas aeria TaxID=2590212 RepID=UPI0012F91B2A|nr:YfiR family protein [Azohydromonas aeria]